VFTVISAVVISLWVVGSLFGWLVGYLVGWLVVWFID